MLGQGLLVGWEFREEPAVWVVGLGVWVEFWVAGDGEVNSVDHGALGQPVAVVSVIFLEETGNACRFVSWIAFERLGIGSYREELVGAI